MDKARMVRAAVAYTELGEIGALLRREGVYASNLDARRKQPREHDVDGQTARKHCSHPVGRRMILPSLRRGKAASADAQRENRPGPGALRKSARPPLADPCMASGGHALVGKLLGTGHPGQGCPWSVADQCFGLAAAAAASSFASASAASRAML